MKPVDTVERNKHYHCLEYDHDQEGDLYLIACGIEQCDRGVTYGPDCRDGFHLHVVMSGKGILNAGGQTVHPHFGQMFLLKDGETVSYTADQKDPWSYCWVTYGGSAARKISEDIGFTEGIYCLDSMKEAKLFYELIYRMHEKPEMNSINDLRRRGVLMEFLALALEATETKARHEERKKEYSIEQYIQQAIEFIHYNYQTITVMDVAEYVGFTRSYFWTIFKQQVGVSPQTYLMHYRLKKAEELLCTTDLPVQKISEKAGYSDPLHFSRAFKNVFGSSPIHYRNHKTEEERI